MAMNAYLIPHTSYLISPHLIPIHLFYTKTKYFQDSNKLLTFRTVLIELRFDCTMT